MKKKNELKKTLFLKLKLKLLRLIILLLFGIKYFITLLNKIQFKIANESAKLIFYLNLIQIHLKLKIYFANNMKTA